MFLICSINIATAESNFVIIDLPNDIVFNLPKNWTIYNDNQRVLLDTVVEILTDEEDRGYVVNSQLPFVADFYTESGAKVAMASIRFYPDMDITQDEVITAGKNEISELDDELKKQIVKSLSLINANKRVTRWLGTKKKTINGITFLVTEYTRNSLILNGDFRVYLYRALIGNRSFTLILSHYTKQESYLGLITDKIANSIRDKHQTTSANEVVLTSRTNNSVMEILYGSEWVLVLVLSFLVTWTIGLTPPALIRFVFLKRPIGKWPAIGFCGVMFMVNMMIFLALGSESKTHIAVILIAFASYYILRKAAKEKPTVTNE